MSTRGKCTKKENSIEITREVKTSCQKIINIFDMMQGAFREKWTKELASSEIYNAAFFSWEANISIFSDETIDFALKEVISKFEFVPSIKAFREICEKKEKSDSDKKYWEFNSQRKPVERSEESKEIAKKALFEIRKKLLRF